MRTLRWIAAGITVVTALAMPSVAVADGGAYIELDRTHYLVGSSATGVAYVAVPEPKQHLLERGPFYVYILPARAWIEEGRPIPAGAIQVGTVAIAQKRKAFELRVSFIVPDLPGDYYGVAICNDPCTISGFREPLSAYMSIVETSREGELLTENSDLTTRTWTLRRKARKAEKATEELEAELAASHGSVVGLSAEIGRLERALEATAPPSSVSTVTKREDRPLVDAWALFAIVTALIVALLTIGLALVFSHRSTPRLIVPDTIAELDDEAALRPAERSANIDSMAAHGHRDDGSTILMRLK